MMTIGFRAYLRQEEHIALLNKGVLRLCDGTELTMQNDIIYVKNVFDNTVGRAIKAICNKNAMVCYYIALVIAS